MKQLFKELVASETGASIDRHGDLMIAKYRKHGKAKQIMAAEEIQALIDERDDALRKVMTWLSKQAGGWDKVYNRPVALPKYNEASSYDCRIFTLRPLTNGKSIVKLNKE